jgi:hypothetical protein
MGWQGMLGHAMLQCDRMLDAMWDSMTRVHSRVLTVRHLVQFRLPRSVIPSPSVVRRRS